MLGSGELPKNSSFLQLFYLLLLTLQCTAHALAMSYSRGVLKERFDGSHAVLIMELSKLILCVLAVIWRNEHGPRPLMEFLWGLAVSSWQLSVPAFVYFLQNWLQFLALSHLDSATFSVLSQLKLLSAAIFSRALLGRSLSWRKWRALVLLVTGVSLILAVTDQSGPTSPPAPVTQTQTVSVAAIDEAVQRTGEALAEDIAGIGHASELMDKNLSDLFWGTTYVLMIVSCSGFAGVYFERVLKSNKAVSLWSRNFQLSLYSIIFGLLNVLLTHPLDLFSPNFFNGFSSFTWLTIQLGAFGGLLVAVVVQHTDTIVKGFASSVGVVTTTLCAALLFGVHLSFEFTVGVVVVVIASLNYAEADV